MRLPKVAVAVLIVSGCATPTPTPTPTPTISLYPEFTDRRIVGNLSKFEIAAIKKRMIYALKDADSARYRFFPKIKYKVKGRSWSNIGYCFMVNAKGGGGGYTGFTPVIIVTEGGKSRLKRGEKPIIRVAPTQPSLRSYYLKNCRLLYNNPTWPEE